MLAQNFMTAEALGFSTEEFAAHVQVLGMLERAELRDGEVAYYGVGEFAGEGNFFNMSSVGERGPCGTIACIAGWVDVLLGRPIRTVGELGDEHRWGTPLWDLYFVDGNAVLAMCSDVRVPQAAQALRNYLTTGAARWSEVLV